MISLSEFERELSKHSEVISVKRAVSPYFNPSKDTGLEVIVRSKIEYFDQEALDAVLQSGKYKGNEDILSRLPDLFQEYKYFIRTDQTYRTPHTSSEAFCDPFMSINELNCQVLHGYMDRNASKVVEALILAPKRFNVLDHVYVISLIKWVKEICAAKTRR